MTTLVSKLIALTRLERGLATRHHLFPSSSHLEIKKSISFKSKAKKVDQDAIDQVVGRKVEVDPDVVVDDEDPHLVYKPLPPEVKTLSEEEIKSLQDKSRLKEEHRRMLYGEVPYTEPKFWTHRTIKYQRRMLAIYGEASGIDPGIPWPTEHEMKIRLEYESVARPATFHEMVKAVNERKQAEEEYIRQRALEVETKMANSEKAKQEFYAKLYLKEKDVREAQERREKLVEEVRRHFGYKVDERDEKFQEMLEKKEKEQRKAKKEARKAVKQQKELAKLTEEGESKKKAKEVAASATNQQNKAKDSKKGEDVDSDDDEK